MKLQFLFLDTLDTLRRRKFHLLIPLAVCTGVGLTLPYLLPKEYESYSTILVENDPLPLIQGQGTYVTPPFDHFATMNEIVRSRTTIAAAIESLGLVETPEELTSRTSQAQQWIVTEKRSDNTFRLAVVHPDPSVAYGMASFLSQEYIRTSMRAKIRQQEDAVKFYEEKVNEYQQAFEQQQLAAMNSDQEDLRNFPRGESSSRAALDRVDSELSETQQMLVRDEQTLQLLESFTESLDDPATLGQIAMLDPAGSVLYINELKSLSIKYSDLLSRYTVKYPEVQTVRRQMLSLLDKSREALETGLRSRENRRNQLQEQRSGLLKNLSQSITTNEAAVGHKADYAMYKELYDTMRLQLEQAKIARSLGEKAGTKFVVLDRPRLADTPAQTSSLEYLLWGMLTGVFAGGTAVFLAEKLDPTIRRRRDIEVFEKPIIAYLP